MSNGGQQSGDVLGGIVGLGLLFWVGSCVFGGSDDPAPTPTPTPTSIATSAPTPSPSPTGEMVRIGSNMLEQAIFDAFPEKSPKGKKAKAKASNAADYLGMTINSAGYLCARPIDAQPVASGQYGVMCRKYRQEGGVANFIVDVRSGNVSEI